MGEDPYAKGAEGHGWQGWIKRSDEVLVVPLCLLDGKAYPLHRREIILGEIDDETNTKIVQP